MKNLMITGAAGFIGSHMCDEALSQGWRVIGLDNFFRGKKEYLPVNDNFIFEEMDLLNMENLKFTIKEYKPDVIIHYAAINGTEYFYEKPWQVLENNISTTMNLLKALEETNFFPEKLVYASSSEIYGEFPTNIPTSEDNLIALDIGAVRDSYASSKAIDEFLVKNFCDDNNISFLILRIFNTYGPRMDTSKYGQVVPEFIRKAFNDKEFTIIGNGRQTRSFCFVKDHTKMVMSLLDKSSGLVLNIGNQEEIRIVDLASEICSIIGRPFNPIFLDSRDNDPLRRCPDLRNLLKLVNPPQYSLNQGLKDTIAWYSKKA